MHRIKWLVVSICAAFSVFSSSQMMLLRHFLGDLVPANCSSDNRGWLLFFKNYGVLYYVQRASLYKIVQNWTPLWLLRRLKIEFRLFSKWRPRFSLCNDQIPKVTWVLSTAFILGQKYNERLKASERLLAKRYICDLILSSIQKVEHARLGSIDARLVRLGPKVGFRSTLYRLALVACSGTHHHSMFRAK